jgi:hypothetical protein
MRLLLDENLSKRLKLETDRNQTTTEMSLKKCNILKNIR